MIKLLAIVWLGKNKISLSFFQALLLIKPSMQFLKFLLSWIRQIYKAILLSSATWSTFSLLHHRPEKRLGLQDIPGRIFKAIKRIITLRQGFSNCFGWQALNLSEKSRYPKGILWPCKCKKYLLKPKVFGLFVALQANFFYLVNFATLCRHLATLKRVVTPSLRTAALRWTNLWGTIGRAREEWHFLDF